MKALLCGFRSSRGLSLVTAVQSSLATISWFGLKEENENQAGGRAAVIYPGAALLHFYTPPAPVGNERSVLCTCWSSWYLH